jgi:hypothetical protein
MNPERPSSPNRPEGRPSRARRVLGWAACVLAAVPIVVALLVVAFYAEENWRGSRAWAKCQQELKAKGERLDWAAYQPAPVPDAQNFLKTPLLEAVACSGRVDERAWSPIEEAGERLVHEAWANARSGRMNWPKYQAVLRSRADVTLSPLPQAPAADLLESFRSIEPQMEELRTASLRPLAQFDKDRSTPFEESRGCNFVAVRLLCQILAFQACAEVEVGHSERAFADLRVLHRFSAALRRENELASLMIGASLQGLAVQPFWEGWAKGRWDDRQLAGFQELFGQLDLLPEFRRVLCAERAGFNALVEKHARQENGLYELWRRTRDGDGGPWDWTSHVPPSVLEAAWGLVPRGWVGQNLATYNRQIQALLPPSLELQPPRVSPREIETLKRRIDQEKSVGGLDGWLGGAAIPRFAKALQAAARIQNLVNQATAVCALERYRKAHGQYPESLSNLVPAFIASLPGDVITGGTLKYRRNSNDAFLLYSVGWNETDDNGVVATNGAEPPEPDFTQGDWVWRYPAE